MWALGRYRRMRRRRDRSTCRERTRCHDRTMTRAGAAGARTRRYDWCRDYARAHQENFTRRFVVPAARRAAAFLRALRLLPLDRRPRRRGRGRPPCAARRLGARAARAATTAGASSRCSSRSARTIDRFDIPADPFLRLIEANRMDQRITRFATYDDLLHYCEHSATPVGRMVLHVLGYRDERRQRLSDATCIGLQLANFWQDVTVDLEKGRVYIPREDLAASACSEDECAQRVVTARSGELMRFEVERARDAVRRRPRPGGADRQAGAARRSPLPSRRRSDARRDRRADYDVLARGRVSRRHEGVDGAQQRRPHEARLVEARLPARRCTSEAR